MRQGVHPMCNSIMTGVVQVVGSGEPHVFGKEDTQAVVWACDAGFCRLVPDDEEHPVKLFDPSWKVFNGIELTPKGDAEFRRLS